VRVHSYEKTFNWKAAFTHQEFLNKNDGHVITSDGTHRSAYSFLKFYSELHRSDHLLSGHKKCSNKTLSVV
jgi:hypothetical protein